MRDYRRAPWSGVLALWMLACPALGAPSGAQPPEQDSIAQYTSLAPVTVSGKQGVVQLRMPRDVYLRAQTSELQDLRLFDVDGNSVPFSLINPADQVRTKRVTVPVRAFPVFDNARNAVGLPAGIEIRTSSDGSVLSVSATQKSAQQSPKTLSSLVLDVRPPTLAAGRSSTQLIGALDLSLPEGTRNYSAKLVLEVSDDLKSWQVLCESTLNWLVNAQTDVLSNSRIAFAPAAFRYARLTWIEGVPIEFGRVEAEFQAQVAAPYETETLVVAPTEGRYPNDLVYAAAIAIPVAKLGLQFQQQNFVLPAVLGQYVEVPGRGPAARMAQQFNPRLRFTFFQLAEGEQRRSNTDLATDSIHASHWVLRSEGALPEKPALRISWVPATMVFVASGHLPYTLAVGRADAASAQSPLAKVVPGFTMDELLASERAGIGGMRQQVVVGGRETPAGAAQSARSRVVLLWSVLLLGVVMLGLMARQLAGQMRGDGRPER